METTIIDGLEVPVVPMLNARILAAIERGGELDMDHWHGRGGNLCGTTHCIAGWIVCLAGKKGHDLEVLFGRYSTGVVASKIFYASCPDMVLPSWNEDNEPALLHLRERAAREQSAALDVDRLRDEAREGKRL